MPAPLTRHAPARPQTPGATRLAVQRLHASTTFPRTFTATIATHLLHIAPAVRHDLGVWRVHAKRIPDPVLSDTAISALQKQGNIEGAALMSALAPAARRHHVIRALCSLQGAYNYLDALSELDCENPLVNSDQLHQALLVALALHEPPAALTDYYAHSPHCYDGGYLRAMVDSCGEALSALPSFGRAAVLAREATARIVDFQTLNLPAGHGGHDALQSWAESTTAPKSELYWWETAAAAGSSLPVHALIAVSAAPSLSAQQAADVAEAYYPWTAALHSLLDSMVDREEDEREGRPSLIANYAGATYTALRLGALAVQATERLGKLADADTHLTILTAMCAYYLSAPQPDRATAASVRRVLGNTLGPSLGVAIRLFETKRLAHALTGHRYR